MNFFIQKKSLLLCNGPFLKEIREFLDFIFSLILDIENSTGSLNEEVVWNINFGISEIIQI